VNYPRNYDSWKTGAHLDDQTEDPLVCGACNGSGEGDTEDSACRRCRGSGIHSPYRERDDHDLECDLRGGK